MSPDRDQAHSQGAPASLSVLVVSCDGYSDLWAPFFTLFRRHWPDCPYPVFLGANHETFRGDPAVNTITVGDDQSWTGNLRAMLDAVESERVLLFLEDFLLTRDVSTQAVERMRRIAVENAVGRLQLRPAPPPTRKLAGLDNLGELRAGDEYRVSTQVSIWDVELLKLLARPEFSPWQFEYLGSLMSESLPGAYWSVYDPIIEYRHGVERGRWLDEGLGICRRAGIEPDLTRRGVFSPEEYSATRRKEDLSPRMLLKRMLPAFAQRTIRRLLYGAQVKEALSVVNAWALPGK